MQKILLTSLMATLLFVAGCKDKENVDPDPSNQSKEILFTLHQKSTEIHNRLHRIGAEKQIGAKEALMLLESEMQNDPDLDEVYVRDSLYMYFGKEGLTQVLELRLFDQNNLSRFRGGGSKGQLTLMSDSDEPKLIENKKVLCFVPELTDFYSSRGDYELSVANKIKASDLNLEVTALYQNQADLDAVKSFGNYGMVIIETHGYPDGFMIGGLASTWGDKNVTNLEEFNAALEKNVSKDLYTLILNGEVRLHRYKTVEDIQGAQWWADTTNDPNGTWELELTAKGLRSLALDLSGTVVLGNMCYSGWSAPEDKKQKPITPIQPAFMSSNPIAYYAYVNKNNDKSEVVENGFARECEDTLIRSLFFDYDTTGNAHLWDGSIVAGDPLHRGKLLFQHHGKKNYTFRAAILIDPRDKKEYGIKTIGIQTWMTENLRYAGVTSYVPQGKTEDDHGRFYSLETMIDSNAQDGDYRQGVCPEGWHVPSRRDWVTLMNFLDYDASGDLFFAFGTTDEIKKRNTAALKLMTSSTAWEGWDFLEDYRDSANVVGLNLKPDGRGYVINKEFSYFQSGTVEYLTSSPLQKSKSTGEYNYERGFYFSFGGFTPMSISSFDINSSVENVGVFPCRCVKD